ncbi:hypothetical protein [Parabacteroides goldsteinii]
MEKEDLKIIAAQQVILYKMLDEIRLILRNKNRYMSMNDYVNELRAKALEIKDQIRI